MQKLEIFFLIPTFHTFPKFGKRHTRKKELVFVLIDFEEWCFGLLGLFHLSKKHVFVICNKILSNITAKVTLGCKV